MKFTSTPKLDVLAILGSLGHIANYRTYKTFFATGQSINTYVTISSQYMEMLARNA